MKTMRSNILIKITAFILCMILFVSTAFMATASITLIILSDGTTTPDLAQNELAEYYLNSRSNQLFYAYVDGIEGYTDLTVEEWAKNEDYYFTIYDENMEILVSNYEGQEYEYSHRNYEYYSEYNYETKDYEGYDIYIDTYLKTDLIKNGLYTLGKALIDSYFYLTTEFLVASFINIIFIIALIIFLCSAAGHKRGYDGIYLNFINKVPFDIFTAIYVALALGEVLICDLIFYDNTLFAAIITCAIFIVIDFALILMYLIGMSVRIKSKTLVKNTVIYRILSFAFKYVKILFVSFGKLIKSIPLIPKTAVAIALIFLLNWGLLAVWDEYEAIFLLFFEGIILIPIFFYFVICLKKLQIAGQRIANGDLEHTVDTAYMIGEFKEYGESLNNIGEGMARAVNEKMKSEHLKTELITNVSHDIKTPLTSIINYVDLIKKENPENEAVRNYLTVLDRQSGRLKKLIEDLIEASKASTGNIVVEKERCELGILLAQTAGEYDERAKQCGLDIIINEYKESLAVMADRRHLWRVFDNLMNNICKYSQNGTRVYLTLDRCDNKAVVTFRNISKSQLNITGDELMERFVRGDSSRNTEGSGLGLSIAKSLVELQGGDMKISVDGDLFKVIINLNII